MRFPTFGILALHRLAVLIIVLSLLVPLGPLPVTKSQAAAPVLVAQAVTPASAQAEEPVGAYDLTVVAKTGQEGITAFGAADGQEYVSLNDNGKVAFIARTGDGPAIFTSDDGGEPQAITPLPMEDRTYGPTLNLNNNNIIYAIDRRQTGNVDQSALRQWNLNGASVELVEAWANPPQNLCPSEPYIPTPVPGCPFCPPLPPPVNMCPYKYGRIYGNLSGNNRNQLTFMTQILRQPNQQSFATYAPIREFTYAIKPPPQPSFADDGYVTFRDDSNDTQRIRRVNAQNFNDSQVIADAADFSEIGISPCSNDSGQVTTFYANLKPEGAARLNAAQTALMYDDGRKLALAPLTPGAGIFASIDTDAGRVVQRVAGLDGNGYLDPGESWHDQNGNGIFDTGDREVGLYDGFYPEERACNNGDPEEMGAVTAVFLANRDGKKGIYTSEVEFVDTNPDGAAGGLNAQRPGALIVSGHGLVVGQGQTLDGLETVTDLKLFDSVNSEGEIAFWASGNAAVSAAAGDAGQAALFTGRKHAVVTGIEVTQAIQDLYDSVPLVARKQTYVRVHVHNDKPNQKLVSSARIKVWHNGGYEFLPNINSPRAIEVLPEGVADRAKLDESFYFQLPDKMLQGTITIEVPVPQQYQSRYCKEPEQRDKDNNAIPNTAKDCKVTVTFEEVQPLNVKFVNIPLEEQGISSHEPGLETLPRIIGDMQSILPIPSLKYQVMTSSFTHARFEATPLALTLVNARLKLLKLSEGCIGLVGCDTLYVGLLADPEIGELYLGQATIASVPGTSDVASAYVGTQNKDYYVFAHEISHLLGREHVLGTGACGRGGGEEPNGETYPEYPYSGGWIGDGKADGYMGFNTTLVQPIPHNAAGDLMTYCARRWVSDYTYVPVMEEIQNQFGVVQMAQTQSDAESILITGVITPSDGKASIVSIQKLNVPDFNFDASPYQLRYEDAQGNSLGSFGLSLERLSGDESLLSFSALVPFNPLAARIAILQDDQLIGARSGSPSAPSVTITSPNGGEVLEGSNAMLSWTANDTDGDALTYLVQYSRDAGTTWSILAVDWPQTSYDLDLRTIAGSDQALIRVLASDGFHTAQDQSDAVFSVARKAPTAIILSPSDNDYYMPGEWITLEADAFDYEDEELPDSAFVWRSNINGDLGTGRTLSVNAAALSMGTHTITLSVTDSDGQKGEESISLRIYQQRPVFPAALGQLPPKLEFFDAVGGTEPLVDILPISNSGDGELTWNANANQPWIKLDATSGTAPHDLLVTIDPSGLSEGTYTGQITISSEDVQNSPQTVEVILTVVPPSSGSALFQLSPTSLVFQAEPGGSNPPAQSLTIQTSDGQEHNWTASPSAPWIQISATSGSTPLTAQVSVDAQGLHPGRHDGQITIRDEASGESAVVPVRFDFQVPATGSGGLQVSPGALTFVANDGDAAPADQPLAIEFSGGALNWTATASEDWIQLESAAGTAPGTLMVGVNMENLAPNTYSGQITILGDVDGTVAVIDVVLVVGSPALQLSSSSLTFATTAGASNPPEQVLTIKNSGTGILNWTLSESVPWLSLSTTSGVAPVNVEVGVNVAGLAAGNYTGEIQVNAGSAQGSPSTISVTLNVAAPDADGVLHLPMLKK